MFQDLIRAKYHQITLSQYVNFADTVDLFKILDVDEPFWKGHMDAGLQNKFLLSLWPGQKSASILLSPNSFDS